MSTFVRVLAVAALEASLIVLVALVVTRILQPSSAALRHAVWAAALGTALLVPVTAVAPPSLRILALPSSVWPMEIIAPAPAAPALRAMPVALSSGGDPASAAGDPNRSSRLWLLIAVVWIAGATGVLGGTAAAHARARALLGRARPVRSGPVHAQLRLLPETAPHEVALFESSEVGGVATIGLWRPVIVLPPGARGWDSRQATAVLAHELAHIRRRDPLTQLLARMACAVHWFNPLIWMAARRMAVERERACDDVVLGAGAHPVEYASLLLALVRSGVPLASPAGALPLVRATELETRLRAILDPRQARGGCPSLGRVALAVAVTGTLALSVPPRSTAMRLEPDRRGDSLSSPRSERLPPVDPDYAVQRSRAAEAGPDSALVRVLRGALDRISRGPQDLVRERAVWALSQVEDNRLIELLLARLGAVDWRVRCYAAWALAQSGDRRAVPLLVKQSGDPNWRVRAMAAFALSAVDDPGARAQMHSLLDDEAWQVRVNAVEFIGRFDDAEARAALRAALKDSHPAVRSAAADALTKPQVSS